ncbi:hypothetical protein E4U14_008487 [Claviceps sp. LM454 group G7]|nr:hypothetical protein E4U14_008487 [Claviceps sp. LM454 group G7]
MQSGQMSLKTEEQKKQPTRFGQDLERALVVQHRIIDPARPSARPRSCTLFLYDITLNFTLSIYTLHFDNCQLTLTRQICCLCLFI